MSLEMKARCEKCNTTLDAAGDAFICSYECTFCDGCTRDVKSVCPECGGELVRRPKRGTAAQA